MSENLPPEFDSRFYRSRHQDLSQFGEKALRLPAKNAPQAVVRVVGRFAAGSACLTGPDAAAGAATGIATAAPGLRSRAITGAGSVARGAG